MTRFRAEDVSVLMSTPPPLVNRNPYIGMLMASLRDIDCVRADYFSWPRAVLGGYRVLHLHWPEALLERRRSRIKTLVRRTLFVLVLLRARVSGTAIVRTVHNTELPSGLDRLERLVLALVERWTTLRIRLNPDTRVERKGPVVTIPHGHYRDHYGLFVEPPIVSGRVTFFGLIRRYKAVPELIDAFAGTRRACIGLTLHVSGEPSSPELADRLRAAADADDRVSLNLNLLSDAELVREIGESELVVLPYPDMHNSGAVLTALSLDRPVLVPDNEVNRHLADEVGPEWVIRFVGPLRADVIVDAVTTLRSSKPAGQPNLTNRDAREIALAHVRAYRQAVTRKS